MKYVWLRYFIGYDGIEGIIEVYTTPEAAMDDTVAEKYSVVWKKSNEECYLDDNPNPFCGGVIRRYEVKE